MLHLSRRSGGRTALHLVHRLRRPLRHDHPRGHQCLPRPRLHQRLACRGKPSGRITGAALIRRGRCTLGLDTTASRWRSASRFVWPTQGVEGLRLTKETAVWGPPPPLLPPAPTLFVVISFLITARLLSTSLSLQSRTQGLRWGLSLKQWLLSLALVHR
jgi:hypothetical protein